VKSTRDSEYEFRSTTFSKRDEIKHIDNKKIEPIPERNRTIKSKLSEITKKTKPIPPTLPTISRSLKKTHSEATTKKNQVELLEAQNLNNLLNLQTDPLLKGVYSPSYFATSFTPYTFTDDMIYKYDSYKVKIPSLLIGDKL
jgi:hypothetical protein